MANLTGELPLSITLRGRPCQSRSRYEWSGGGLVLTITTVIPERELAFELISTYAGHQDTETVAVHLTLGCGRAGEIGTSRHSGAELNPVDGARACAYDHAHRVIEALGDGAQVALGEHTFSEFERLE